MKCPKCNTNNLSTSRYCSSCGYELPVAQESSLSETRLFRTPKKKKLAIRGTFAGKYKIIDRIGSGAMGLIYKAQDTTLKRMVALKFLPPELTREEEARQRFIREAQAASALDHPNICTIYEIEETDTGHMFIAMAYYGGETLKEKIKRGPLSVDQAIEIAIQIAQGLGGAHQAGIIHRDIKPANIVITERGEIKILDFGLAKLAGQVGLTRMGTTMGTVIYMSPEQARGEEVDHQADIWSLGVILYEMLTGRRPFKGDHDQTVIHSILNVDPEPATRIRMDVPIELEWIVKRAIHKDINGRYHQAEEMLADLKTLKSKLEAPGGFEIFEAMNEEPSERPISEPKPIAVITFENQTGDGSYDYLGKAIPNLLITSLEQSRYLHVVTWERMRDLLRQMGKANVEVIDKDLGFELCRMDGIDTIVVGSFTKAGDMFATDVKVLDVESKNLLRSASSKGGGVDSILKQQIDELSREISRGVGIAEHRLDQSRLPIAEVTTTSMDAYKWFLRGRESYERLYNQDARKFLEKAIEIDPTFAVAHLYLAWTYGRLRETKARSEAYEKAKAFSDRASRKERLYIEATYADSMEHDLEKRFNTLKQIAKEYPREKPVHHLLASHYRVNKQLYQAVEEYHRVLELDPSYGWAMNELGYMYADVGDFEKAREYFEKYALVSPGDANPIDSMGELYFRMGRLDEAIAKYREVLRIRPDFYYAYWEIAYISALKEGYQEAIEWIEKYIDQAPSFGTKAEGLLWKSFYLYWQGRFQDALSEAQTLRESAEETESTLWKTAADRITGWIFHDMENFELSRSHFDRCLDTIRANQAEFAPAQKSYSLWTPDWIPTLTAAYTFALGLVDLKEGRIDEATSKIDEIRPFLPHYSALLHTEVLLAEDSYEKAITVCEKSPRWKVPYMSDTDSMLAYNLPPLKDVLARIYWRKGDSEKAIHEYERLTTFDPNSKNRRLIHPLCYSRLAELYEAQGDSEKAAAQSRRFLKLWKNR